VTVQNYCRVERSELLYIIKISLAQSDSCFCLKLRNSCENPTGSIGNRGRHINCNQVLSRYSLLASTSTQQNICACIYSLLASTSTQQSIYSLLASTSTQHQVNQTNGSIATGTVKTQTVSNFSVTKPNQYLSTSINMKFTPVLFVGLAILADATPLPASPEIPAHPSTPNPSGKITSPHPPSRYPLHLPNLGQIGSPPKEEGYIRQTPPTPMLERLSTD
jgi:hypothetical protein